MFLVGLTGHSSAKVDPKNYDFSLDKFEIFKPDSTLKIIQAKYPKGVVAFKKGRLITYKYYVEHLRYKFPVFVQFKENKVLDFYAKLPSYFLHNIFHQSLINRIGKQDSFKRVEEQAIYVWKNKDGKRHIYFGSCTITCFPVYYSVQNIKEKNYETLIQKFSNFEAKD